MTYGILYLFCLCNLCARLGLDLRAINRNVGMQKKLLNLTHTEKLPCKPMAKAKFSFINKLKIG